MTVGEVRPDVPLGLRGGAEEQQSGADADLEGAAWTQGENPFDGCTSSHSTISCSGIGAPVAGPARKSLLVGRRISL